jgi:hypothetical protein
MENVKKTPAKGTSLIILFILFLIISCEREEKRFEVQYHFTKRVFSFQCTLSNRQNASVKSRCVVAKNTKLYPGFSKEYDLTKSFSHNF